MPLTLIIEILMYLINKKITFKIKLIDQCFKDKIFVFFFFFVVIYIYQYHINDMHGTVYLVIKITRVLPTTR